jgi:hypothetical protein
MLLREKTVHKISEGEKKSYITFFSNKKPYTKFVREKKYE